VELVQYSHQFMTTAFPKQPTIGSIVLGIGLFIVTLLAFLRIPDLVKFTGAVFMYVPAKVGLIGMVTPQDVIPLRLEENPSSIVIPAPGQYLLYLNNYDLLVLHDAVVARNLKPWIKIQADSMENEIAVTLIGRGLAWYDTPFAPGRPVVLFKVDQPGKYWVVHPTRVDTAYVVPDTTTGKESLITFWVLVEVALIGGIVLYIFRKRTAFGRRKRLDLQAQNRARAEENWSRIRKRADEKRKEEDQPYWKKR
jgi:hypothetical protein